jgi:hypothetical protein
MNGTPAQGGMTYGSPTLVPLVGGSAGGGGGWSGVGAGAGRIRINTTSGNATLTGGTVSPDTTTPCTTQGILH